MSEKEKKPYIVPKMEIIEMPVVEPLLQCSGGDNPYWGGCWGEDGGWGSEKEDD